MILYGEQLNVWYIELIHVVVEVVSTVFVAWLRLLSSTPCD